MNLIDAYYYLQDYEDIWFVNCDSRYRCLKGGRATGKTYQFIGLEPIFKILSDPRRNIMFIRQNYKDNAGSNYNQIKACIRKLGLMHLFKFTTSPHKIILKRTGQCMVFGGMNDVENILSTSFEVGYFTDLYFEEASQLKSYEDFRFVDGSMRIPNYEENLKCQITFLFNAWDVGHWLYDVFFKGNLEDDPDELESKGYQFREIPNFNLGADGSGLALHISSYKCNKYNGEQKLKNILDLKEKAYDIYLVEGLGCWGNTADRTYTHWKDSLIKKHEEIRQTYFDYYTIGIDTGYSNGEGKIKYSEDNAPRLGSAMAVELIGVADEFQKIMVIDEYFDSNNGRSSAERKTAPQYMKEILETIETWMNEYNLWDYNIGVFIDSADVGFRDSLQSLAPDYGLDNLYFEKSTKQPILTRVRFENLLMAYDEFLVSERCKNLIREIKNARADKLGHVREDFDDHALTSFEYGSAPVFPRMFRWKNWKAPN